MENNPYPPSSDVGGEAAVTWVTANSSTHCVTGKCCDYIGEPHCLQSQLKCGRRKVQLLKLVKVYQRL